jgi:ribosome-associated toxin RatA of RatAB toxin-antitoxin module
MAPQEVSVVGEALLVRPLRGPCGEYGAHGTVDIEQDASRVYDFMRQIEEQPKWNAGVKMSQVVGRVNQTTTHVKQVLRWSFLALRGDFNVNLAMIEEPQKMQIRTEMLQGSMMRHFSSSVGVQRLGPNQCRLEMSLLMQPSIYVPFGVRHMVSGQVRKQLHGVLTKVKDTLDNEPKQQTQPGVFAALFGQPLLLGDSKSRGSGLCRSESPLSLDSVLRGMLKLQPLDVHA